MREGAIDYLAKPFSPRCCSTRSAVMLPAQKVEKRAVVYGDPRTAELFQLATRVAVKQATVMVTGPSGTGKEVLARYIHDHSSRAEQAFVAINCAAIPENMLEATCLATRRAPSPVRCRGALASSSRLREEPCCSTRSPRWIWGCRPSCPGLAGERGGAARQPDDPPDVRVIATSNRDLKKRCRTGCSREDLYYRLNVFPCAGRRSGSARGHSSPGGASAGAACPARWGCRRRSSQRDARERLMAHPWPGNVRELDNVVQRALILCPDGLIDCEHLILEETDETLVPA